VIVADASDADTGDWFSKQKLALYSLLVDQKSSSSKIVSCSRAKVSF
jgi:hypothetical protein